MDSRIGELNWIKPAPTAGRELRGTFNPSGWQDEMLAGPIPTDRRNIEMLRLIGRWRTRLSEAECRLMVAPIAEKWKYDATEYAKLEAQITTAYSNPAVYEVPEEPETPVITVTDLDTTSAQLDDFLRDIQTPKDRSRVIPTPWKTVNEQMLGGIYPATSGSIVGRMNAGKTSLGSQQAYHTAVSGFSACYVTLELSWRYVWARIIGQQSGGVISPGKVRAYMYGELRDQWLGTAIEQEIEKLRAAIGDRLVIKDTLGSVAELDEYLAMNRGRFQLVLTDQLQHFDPPQGSTEGWSKDAANSRKLVRLASRHDLAVLSMCQVNRDDDKDGAAFKVPRMSEIKGGSSMEHDMEYSWNIAPLDASYTTLRLHLAKQRGQPSCEIRLDHNPAYNLTTGNGWIVPGGGS